MIGISLKCCFRMLYVFRITLLKHPLLIFVVVIRLVEFPMGFMVL